MKSEAKLLFLSVGCCCCEECDVASDNLVDVLSRSKIALKLLQSDSWLVWFKDLLFPFTTRSDIMQSTPASCRSASSTEPPWPRWRASAAPRPGSTLYRWVSLVTHLSNTVCADGGERHQVKNKRLFSKVFHESKLRTLCLFDRRSG